MPNISKVNVNNVDYEVKDTIIENAVENINNRVVDATTTTKGMVQFATNSEAEEGMIPNKVISPRQLKDYVSNNPPPLSIDATMQMWQAMSHANISEFSVRIPSIGVTITYGLSGVTGGSRILKSSINNNLTFDIRIPSNTPNGDQYTGIVKNSPIGMIYGQNKVHDDNLAKDIYQGVIRTTTDGINFARHTLNTRDDDTRRGVGDVVYSPKLNKYIAVCRDKKIYTTSTAAGTLSWTEHGEIFPFINNYSNFHFIEWSEEQEKFLAINSAHNTPFQIAESTDGVNWTILPIVINWDQGDSTTPQNNYYGKTIKWCSGFNKWVIPCQDRINTLYTSGNGLSWDYVRTNIPYDPGGAGWSTIEYSPEWNMIVINGTNGINYTTDLLTFKYVPMVIGHSDNTVCWAKDLNKFLILNSNCDYQTIQLSDFD